MIIFERPKVLINYFKEIYISWIRNLDGNLGRKLRFSFYKKHLKYLGDNAFIDTGVFMQGPEFISIGDNTHIDKSCILVASSDNLDLSYRAIKEVGDEDCEIKKGELFIGKNTHIVQNCLIFAYGGVYIGDNCTMSTGSKIYSLTSLPNNPFDKKQIVSIMPYSGISPSLIGPVVLKDNVWLGINVCVFPGVTIGEDSFVRTNSLVQESFPRNSYIAGDPAKYIKHRFE